MNEWQKSRDEMIEKWMEIWCLNEMKGNIDKANRSDDVMFDFKCILLTWIYEIGSKVELY